MGRAAGFVQLFLEGAFAFYLAMGGSALLGGFWVSGMFGIVMAVACLLGSYRAEEASERLVMLEHDKRLWRRLGQ